MQPRLSKCEILRASRAKWASSPKLTAGIKNTFKAGATVEEIMEVLKLGMLGVQAANLGVTLLTEELERNAAA